VEEELRARADAGDQWAAFRLADLLAKQGDIEALRPQVDARRPEAAGLFLNLGSITLGRRSESSAELVAAKTLRRRLLMLPGRLTRSARRCRLHLPTNWPWATLFLRALVRLRAIPRHS
jgi:hypothetical protein